MLATLEQMTPPRTFLLDTFFSSVETHNTQYVDIDVVRGNRKLASFVKPISQGEIVERLGYSTKSIKAPYIKEKVSINTDNILSRLAGNTIYMGNSSPAQRAAQELAKDLIYLQELITRREEWMASSLLQAGKITLTQQYEGIEIDFSMDGDHIASADTMWSESTSTPIQDLREWCQMIAQDSGLVPDTCILGSDALNALWDNAQIRAVFNMLKVDLGQISPKDLPNGSSFIGTLRIGGATLDCYSYDEWYDLSGTLYPMVPTKKLFLGSTKARTARRYGAIQDLDFDGLVSARYFPKTWTEKDPSVMWLMLQSAPVVCMHQVDAFGCFTVLS
jgi:hypothetical protein